MEQARPVGPGTPDGSTLSRYGGLIIPGVLFALIVMAMILTRFLS